MWMIKGYFMFLECLAKLTTGVAPNRTAVSEGGQRVLFRKWPAIILLPLR